MRDEYAAIMPKADILPFRPRPSRDFAVRQATLMALHETFPMLLSIWGYSWLAGHPERALSVDFLWSVRQNFREICARYDLQEMS